MMLGQHFALKDLGRLHYFLGVEASWIMDGNLDLSRTQYITDLLQWTTMLSSKPQPTPMISSSHLTQDGSTVVLNALHCTGYLLDPYRIYFSLDLNLFIVLIRYVNSCI